MKPSLIRAFPQKLNVALISLSLGVTCGCGSGLGLGLSTGGSGSTPAPLATANSPQLGYFWNTADATLRPVLGIPGASQIGQSVVPAGTYTTGAASSSSSVALLQEPDGSLDAMTLPSGQPVHLSAATSTGALIRFAPGGGSAVVFTPGSAALTVVTGLASAPAARALAAPSAVQDAAIGDSGSIAIAIRNNIQVIGTGGVPTSLATVGSLGGLAFASGDSLLFADASANTLSLVRNASTQPALAVVPSGGLLRAPAALGLSPSGQWALIANSAEASTVRIDLTAQNAPLLIQCACTPALVAPITGTATFRITAPDGGPLWAVDAAVSTPRSFFIPALPGAGSAVQQ